MISAWLQDTESANDLKFSREQGFFDKNPSIRWMIALFFMVVLFAFIHFREVRVEILELNSIAPNYIVSQVDFDFFDEEATIILKQEAVRDIGRIYEIPEKQIHQRATDLDHSLLYHLDWHKNDAQTFEEMFLAAERVAQELVKVRLADPRTLQKMRELGLPTAGYEVLTTIAVVSDQEVELPATVWGQIESSLEGFTPQTRTFVLDYFRKQPWTLVEDIPAQKTLRKKIQQQVPDKYTHVSAGNRIIDQGERVTTRHIAMLQSMKTAIGESRNLLSIETILGSLLFTILVTTICTCYFHVNHPRVLASNRKLFLLVTIIILTLALSKATEFFLLSTKSSVIDDVDYPLFVPFAAILLCSLINSGVALFVSGFLTIILMMSLALENQEFIIINLAASIVAILSTRNLRRRKDVFMVCAKAWLAGISVIFAIHLYDNTILSVDFLSDLISASIFMLLTAVLVVGLLPLLESSFHIMTDVSLIEYMDPNNDLLRRLTIEAPGTYQHSVVVGNMSEAAALAIGSNGLFCRVATLYHDIGKMSTAQYFTENQMGNMNIHQLLTPLESAQVIMAHVPEGVALARKAGLPEQIIDIIKEHHGTTLVYYFYHKQLEKVGGDKSLVDEHEFRYPGPKPRTKESAIIMIADSFEAAARSLEDYTEESVTELIEHLIRQKWADGQFDESLLTFEELVIIKKTLIKTLLAAGHSRVKYPAQEDVESGFADQA